MIVYKKKLGNSVVLVVALVPLGLFLFASSWALVTERPLTDKLVFFLFFVISALGLKACWRGIKKLASTSPELEVTDDALIIYDNPEYKRIEFEDIVDCGVFRAPRSVDLLAISVKPDAPYRSNANRFQQWYFDIPSGNAKTIFIALDFADVDPQALAALIRNGARRKK